jgi:hypothetical protein
MFDGPLRSEVEFGPASWGDGAQYVVRDQADQFAAFYVRPLGDLVPDLLRADRQRLDQVAGNLGVTV